MKGYYPDEQSDEFFITDLYSKVKRRKKIGSLILYSCISVIGYIWVWILAIWWLVSFRRTDEDFLDMWSKFPQFEVDFPYRTENFDFMTKNQEYLHLVKRKNSIKMVLILILAVPLYGYVLVIMATLLTVGIILILYNNQMKKPDDYLSIRMNQKHLTPKYPRVEKGFYCKRCGKQLPPQARYCNICAYPVNIPQQKEATSQRVSFKQAVDLLDSETYPRSSRMDIEFECLVLEPASPEQTIGPAPYRKIRVTDPGQLITRTLYIWGDPNKKHNINLAGSLEKGDRLLIMGPSRPKDDSRYYRDETGQDVFWISSWDGTALGSGTRLLKLQTITPTQAEEEPISVKSKDIIEFEPKTPVIQQDTITPPFYCQLCSIKHPAGTPRMQCDACGRYVCIEAFADMARVGRTNCPMCDGKLISI